MHSTNYSDKNSRTVTSENKSTFAKSNLKKTDSEWVMLNWWKACGFR